MVKLGTYSLQLCLQVPSHMQWPHGPVDWCDNIIVLPCDEVWVLQTLWHQPHHGHMVLRDLKQAQVAELEEGGGGGARGGLLR